MSFKDKYPDFAAIEGHIRRARAERAVAIATMLTNAIMGVVNGVKRLGSATGKGLAAERDRRAVESDAFLKRSVPRY
jgi:hypothetical protein